MSEPIGYLVKSNGKIRVVWAKNSRAAARQMLADAVTRRSVKLLPVTGPICCCHDCKKEYYETLDPQIHVYEVKPNPLRRRFIYVIKLPDYMANRLCARPNQRIINRLEA